VRGARARGPRRLRGVAARAVRRGGRARLLVRRRPHAGGRGPPPGVRRGGHRGLAAPALHPRPQLPHRGAAARPPLRAAAEAAGAAPRPRPARAPARALAARRADRPRSPAHGARRRRLADRPLPRPPPLRGGAGSARAPPPRARAARGEHPPRRSGAAPRRARRLLPPTALRGNVLRQEERCRFLNAVAHSRAQSRSSASAGPPFPPPPQPPPPNPPSPPPRPTPP